MLGGLPTQIQALFIGAILTGIGQLLRPKAKVRWGELHRWGFTFTEKDGTRRDIYVSTFIVNNLGRANAINIDINFARQPHNFALWPTRRFSQAQNPDGSFSITIPELGKREFVGIETQSLGIQDQISSVTFGGTLAKTNRYWPQIVWPQWAAYIVLALLFVGVSAVGYWCLRLLTELWRLVA